MQGGARKAAMAGFFFFTKNGWMGQRPPPAAHRARQTAKASDAGTEAGAAPPPPTAPLPRGRLALWRQRPLRRHPRPPRASGRRRRQGCRAARRIGADSVFLCDGGALYQERGRERRGGAGGDGRSGRAHGMEERMMAGPGGGNGENGRESGRVRTGQDEEESGRAWRGGMQGPRKRSHDQGKAGVRGGGQREGSAGRCGRWMDARGRRTNGEERRPAGRKRRAPVLQNDPAGVRKNSAPLLCKATRRARAKIARHCFAKRPGGRAQK